MSVPFVPWRRFLPICFLACGLSPAPGAVRDVSVAGSPLVSVSGGGDSGSPILSGDGRYVVFSSAANNLVVCTNGLPIPAGALPVRNVYRRDRVSGSTALVSVNLSGVAGGNADSTPRGISSDGRYVLFESAASDLVSGDTNNAGDIFLRDVTSGATFLVSLNTNGVAGNGLSRNSVMTPDALRVAFTSEASDLVGGDTNGIADVFVRDLQAGTTVLASVGASAKKFPALPSLSDSPQISPNGRYVAFYSTATNIVTGGGAGGDVYVRDLTAGTTVWASTGARALYQSLIANTSITCYNPVVSDDGQFVAFECSPSVQPGSVARGIVLRYNASSGLTDVVSTNANVAWESFESMHALAMTPDGRFLAFVANEFSTNGATTSVYSWDGNSGVLTLASGDLGGLVPTNSACDWPSVSTNGRYVGFISTAPGLVTNVLRGDYHAYLRDLTAIKTVLLDSDTNGAGAGAEWGTAPAMNRDGSLVAVTSADDRLVTGDYNGSADVFVRNPALMGSELVSVRDVALPGLTPVGDSAPGTVAVSRDGRYAAFVSAARGLGTLSTQGYLQVYVRDLQLGTNMLVSVNSGGGAAGDSPAYEAAISGDGRYVAFTSWADDLVAGDTNGVQDVFLRDLQTGVTVAVSVSADGSTLGNGASFSPEISADGRFVLFRSLARNLAAGTFTSGLTNLYLRDLQSGTTYALTSQALDSSGVQASSMTPDGRRIAFATLPSLACYLWDSQAASRIYTNTSLLSSTLSLAPDGQKLAYLSGNTNLTVLDLVSNSAWSVCGWTLQKKSGLKFAADSSSMGYATTGTNAGTITSIPPGIYLYDFRSGTSLLVSGNAPVTGASSDAPDISADGRFVAYRSFVTNSAVPQVLAYDRAKDSTTLLTANGAGLAAGGRSLPPMFSGDGRCIIFRSWAPDLAAFDFNNSGDVFEYALLYASIAPVGGYPVISWPATPGQTYQVFYKDRLGDPTWQLVNGTATINGIIGSMTDPLPSPAARFYQVIAH
ncbi:MAG: hypothetical protein U1F98_05840 [Verrucomicrobiota bacterium]